MVPYSDDSLQTTFIVRNISIDKESLTSSGNIVNNNSNTTTNPQQNTGNTVNTNNGQQTNDNGQQTITQ